MPNTWGPTATSGGLHDERGRKARAVHEHGGRLPPADHEEAGLGRCQHERRRIGLLDENRLDGDLEVWRLLLVGAKDVQRLPPAGGQARCQPQGGNIVRPSIPHGDEARGCRVIRSIKKDGGVAVEPLQGVVHDASEIVATDVGTMALEEHQPRRFTSSDADKLFGRVRAGPHPDPGVEPRSQELAGNRD